MPLLARALRDHTWRPGPFRHFLIRDTKPRLISSAPFRDRIVHHALCNVLEPIFERSFIHDSYACRKGKGTHAAVDRYQEFARTNRYVLKCDVRKFFPSVDHVILKGLLVRKFKDRDILELEGVIIDHAEGESCPFESSPHVPREESRARVGRRSSRHASSAPGFPHAEGEREGYYPEARRPGAGRRPLGRDGTEGEAAALLGGRVSNPSVPILSTT